MTVSLTSYLWYKDKTKHCSGADKNDGLGKDAFGFKITQHELSGESESREEEDVVNGDTDVV